MAGNDTPMMRQYNEIKKDAVECILFYRLGDFYEMFGDDAVEAAEILDISLTTRNKKAENPMPMCGIPAKSYERYVAKLINSGRKVAIADQVSDPSEPGIVQRKITRIITPGTVFSEQVLDSKKRNFLAAFVAGKTLQNSKNISVAFAEVTTGEFFVQNFTDPLDAIQEIQKMEVSEVLFTPEQFREYADSFAYFSGALSRHFMPEDTKDFLITSLRTKNLKPFGIENFPVSIDACALLFSFLEDTQKSEISHISGIHLRDTSKYIPLDCDTITNLELFASSDGDKKKGLFAFMDQTQTAIGGRALQEAFLFPLQEKPAIDDRLDKVAELVENQEISEIFTDNLSQISDIERIISKISTGRALPKDLVLLKKSLQSIQKISSDLEKSDTKKWEQWNEKIKNFF